MNNDYIYKQSFKETSKIKDNKSGVYGILNTCNNKIYIGSSLNLRKRHNAHKTKLNCNRHANKHLQKAIFKYKIDNFEFVILEYCNEKLILEKEQYWINKFNSNDNKVGYNKRKIAESNYGYSFNMPDEAKEKLRKIGKERGKTKEFKEFMSLVHKGKNVSNETRKKSSESHKGYIMKNSSKQKISKSLSKK